MLRTMRRGIVAFSAFTLFGLGLTGCHAQDHESRDRDHRRGDRLGEEQAGQRQAQERLEPGQGLTATVDGAFTASGACYAPCVVAS
jgi:hypothetical protein